MFDMCLLPRSGGRSKRQRKRVRDTWYRVRVWLHARTYTSTERYRRRAYTKYFDAAIREHDAMVVCVCVCVVSAGRLVETTVARAEGDVSLGKK